MIKFFKNKNKNDMDSSLIKITALLIHAAKIDENYTENERKIIRKAIVELDSKDNNIDEVLIKAEEIEKNSNQILDFTKEVKNMNELFVSSVYPSTPSDFGKYPLILYKPNILSSTPFSPPDFVNEVIA